MRGGARQRRPQRVLVSLVLVLALAVWAVPSVSRAAPDDADRQYQAALRTHGPCPEHRFSYINVRRSCGSEGGGRIQGVLLRERLDAELAADLPVDLVETA